MIVNSLTSGFMHEGEPVANGFLLVYNRKESPRSLAELYVDGEKQTQPVSLNQNGRILLPVETKLNSVYCEVWSNSAYFLFGFELSGNGALLRFVPNSFNPESTGVTDEGKIAIKDRASLALSGEACIDLGSSAKLYAMGAGAISGLQGAIHSDDTELYANCRVYKMKDLLYIVNSSFETKDSFLEGDVFYFIADETLEGDATLLYKDIEGKDVEEYINKDNSVTLMLVSKEGEDADLRFKKMSDTEYVPNIFKITNEQIALSSTLGEEIQINLMHVIPHSNSYHFVKAGKTLVYDSIGNIGIVTSIGRNYPGATVGIKTIATSGTKKEDIFTGTRNQVVLGDGTFTSEETEDGEKFNAASSLFAEPDIRNDALDAVYGEFMNQGSRISMDLFNNLIFSMVRERLIESGDLVGGGAGNFVNTVTITITAPTNGMPMSNEVMQLESEDIYVAGTIFWEPDDDTANGTYSYTGYFTLSAMFPYQFHRATPIRINGGAVLFERELIDNFVLRLTLRIPATMQPNPAPRIFTINPLNNVDRPNIDKQDDGHYQQSVVWNETSANNFTATFTFNADENYRWNDNVVYLNYVPYEGDLSPDGTTLTITVDFFKDSRDNKFYRTVRIGNQTWMAENLNYEGAGVYYGSGTTPGNAEPFPKAGRLYTWNEAMTVTPPGYHLPSDAEWDTLVNFIGGAVGGSTKLKSRNSEQPQNAAWYQNGDGTDQYKFTGLPADSRNPDGTFPHFRKYGIWWSATAWGADSALNRNLYYTAADVGRWESHIMFSFSVRCIKD